MTSVATTPSLSQVQPTLRLVQPMKTRKIISGRYLQRIILAHIQVCWRINKIQAMLAMTMVKMAMVVKVFICQTHTCLTLLVIMKSRYNCNTLMTLRI